MTCRILCRYVEAVVHLWLDTYAKPAGTVWAERAWVGTNGPNPLLQGVHAMPQATPKELAERRKPVVNRRRSLKLKENPRQMEYMAGYRDTMRARLAALPSEQLAAARQRGKEASKVYAANRKAKLETLPAPVRDTMIAKRRVQELGYRLETRGRGRAPVGALEWWYSECII